MVAHHALARVAISFVLDSNPLLPALVASANVTDESLILLPSYSSRFKAMIPHRRLMWLSSGILFLSFIALYFLLQDSLLCKSRVKM